MTPADQARLELAKLAYRAAEPSAAEVQAGVRRARLALRRPAQHGAWLGKGLVGLVLAACGLAYAKSDALGELENWALAGSSVEAKGAPLQARAALLPPAQRDPVAPIAPAREEAASNTPVSSAAVASAAVASAAAPNAHARAGTTSPASSRSAHSAATRLEPDPTASQWGRVGQALARGDEQAALGVLDTLSHSADQATRDKAELGRAQLLLSRGDAAGACALASSLTARATAERIERQARALLSSCKR